MTLWLIGLFAIILASMYWGTRRRDERRARERAEIREMLHREEIEELNRLFPPKIRKSLKLASESLRNDWPFPGLSDFWNDDMAQIIASVGARAGYQTAGHSLIMQKLSACRISRAQAAEQISDVWPEDDSEPFQLPRLVTEAVTKSQANLALTTIAANWVVFVADLTVLASDGDDEQKADTLEDFTVYVETFVEFLSAVQKTRSTQGQQGAPMSPPQSTRSLLGIPDDATPEQIKVAYRQKVRQWHPDLLENMAPELRAYANQELARINSAYEELSKNA